jgi:hypothetical protein
VQPASKRQRMDSLDPPKPKSHRRHSAPVHKGRCCNCTEGSTCKTRRCACRKANQSCTSFDCLEQCSNKGGPKPPCVLQSTVPETDESLAPAVVLPPASTPTALDIAKCVLLVSGKEAKESCGIDQLCAALNQESKAEFTPCNMCGINTAWKRDFFSLTLGMRSMS